MEKSIWSHSLVWFSPKLLLQTLKHTTVLKYVRPILCVCVFKVRSMCFAKVEKKLACPAQSADLNTNEHLLDKQEHKLHPRPSCLISVPDFTNGLVAKWKKTLQSWFKI